MTKTRFKNTVSRQTSIVIIGASVLVFALAYFSREPFPFSAVAHPYSSSPGSTTTAKTLVTTATHRNASAPTPSAKRTSPPSASPQPVRTPSAAMTGVGSLNDLLAIRQSLSCTVSARNGTDRTGTAYISGGKFRATLANGVSFIDDSTHYYAWAQGAHTGLVLPIVSASGSTLALHGALDPAQSLSYGCNPWSAQASSFTPPSTITFTNTSGN